MSKCGKVAEIPAKKLVESIWKKIVEKTSNLQFPHKKRVLHISFTKSFHLVLHKEKYTFTP